MAAFQAALRLAEIVLLEKFKKKEAEKPPLIEEKPKG